MPSQAYRSAFVPHDIKAPIKGAAVGPLAGLSAVVKDMYDIAGERMGCGNPDWLASHAPAVRHCPPVQKILDAGATIIGKTICDEFFYSVTGANAHYGTPVNARAWGRLPGGSSVGSASAVGAGVCDFALGSDTGGSVRIPASFNGIYGLRPTHERIEHSGVADMAPSFDVPGWFASTPGVFRNVGAVLLDSRRVRCKLIHSVYIVPQCIRGPMIDIDTAKTALRNLFRRTPIAQLDALYRALKTRSRMSVFRRLSLLGYLTSYTHTARYYTLREIPRLTSSGCGTTAVSDSVERAL